MKETVYIAERLRSATHGKLVAEKLENHFDGGLKIIPHSPMNEWCRDYMPVKNANGEWVQFVYNPSYLNSQSGQKTIPDVQKIHHALDLKPFASDIILDGGAVELHGKKAIVSDRVFRDNAHKTVVQSYDQLKKELAVEELIIIPQHPLDFTGHVDGMVRFISNETVIINDLSEELTEAKRLQEETTNRNKGKLLENWYYSFLSALNNTGLGIDILPTAYNLAEKESHGNGIFINFLNLNDRILMPWYQNEKFEQFNNKARAKLTEFTGKAVAGIPCDDLAKQGGMINCITWQLT